MSEVAIKISCRGDCEPVVRVYVNDKLIGLIEELNLDFSIHEAPLKLKVALCSVNNLPADQYLRNTLQQYRQLLQSLPFVELFDTADTLPSGMPAVRPESELATRR